MIEIRGRNGWFIYDRHNITVGKESVFVSIYSSRQGKMPPVMFKGPPAEVAQLLENMAKEIRSENQLFR